jgi:peptide/nickel transport system ATP-binding protein
MCPRIIGDKCKNEAPTWQIGDNSNAIRCHIDIKNLKNKQI